MLGIAEFYIRNLSLVSVLISNALPVCRRLRNLEQSHNPKLVRGKTELWWRSAANGRQRRTA